ncbi:MAG: ArsR family transcriptional regulator, partial [Thermoplasmata archaeon]
EISDVLAAAVMDEKEFKKIEKKILDLVGDQGKFAGDVAEALGATFTMLKSLVKRSAKLEYRGHRIEKRKDVTGD